MTDDRGRIFAADSHGYETHDAFTRRAPWARAAKGKSLAACEVADHAPRTLPRVPAVLDDHDPTEAR